jgi:hypothetical protein
MTVGVVILGFGPQPMNWISVAAETCGPGAIFCPDVARMSGASIAVGSPEALAELRNRLEAGALHSASKEHPGLSESATRWLASGERGVSSNTIFSHLSGTDALRGASPRYPNDPADLRRCRLLMEQVPELQPLFPMMAEVSPVWAALVDNWARICETMDLEAPDWRDPNTHGLAEQTYDLMKQAIKRGREAAIGRKDC